MLRTFQAQNKKKSSFGPGSAAKFDVLIKKECKLIINAVIFSIECGSKFIEDEVSRNSDDAIEIRNTN